MAGVGLVLLGRQVWCKILTEYFDFSSDWFSWACAIPGTKGLDLEWGIIRGYFCRFDNHLA